MPRVPTYDNPTVELQPLPGARQESVVSPGLLDAGADRQIAQGAALEAAGRRVSAVADQMIYQQDLRDVQAATATLGKAQQDFHLDAVKNRTGMAADGLTADFDQWNAKQVEEISKKLTSPGQQAAFQTMAGRSALAVRASLGAFQTGEQAKAADVAFDADVKNTISNGAIALDPEAAMVQRDLLMPKIAAYTQLRHMDAATTQNLTEKILTDFHKQRIQQLAVNNPNEAAAYFTANKGEIAGSEQAELGKFATQATATSLGTSAALDVWKVDGPQDYRGVPQLDKMEQSIRDRLKGNDAAVDAGIKTLRDKLAAFKDARTETDNSLAGDVVKAIMGDKPISQVRMMPSFLSLSSEKQREMDTYAENRAYMKIQRASATESLRQQQLQRTGFAAYLNYSNPQTLAGMSENQIIALAPTLGDQLTDHLMTQHRSLTNTDSRMNAQIDNEDFNHVAQQIGLRPFDPKKSEDEKAALGELKFAVETRIDAAQHAAKRPLTRDEKMSLVKQTVDDKVMQHNAIFPDKEVPAALLPPEKMGDAYVVVGQDKVPLASIPPTFRAQAIAARQAAGLPTSEGQLAQLWVQSRKNQRTASGAVPVHTPVVASTSSNGVPR